MKLPSSMVPQLYIKDYRSEGGLKGPEGPSVNSQIILKEFLYFWKT